MCFAWFAGGFAGGVLAWARDLNGMSISMTPLVIKMNNKVHENPYT